MPFKGILNYVNYSSQLQFAKKKQATLYGMTNYRWDVKFVLF